MSISVTLLLEEARLLSRAALTTAEIGEVLRRVGGLSPQEAVACLGELRRCRNAGLEPGIASANRVVALAREYPALPVYRTLLILATLHGSEQAGHRPLPDCVARLYFEEVRDVLYPSPKSLAYFQPDNVRYWELADIMLFRRFPGGQMHWSESAVSLRWFAKSSGGILAGLRTFAILGGRDRFWETHLNARRKYPNVVLEKEGMLSYYRMAKCMELCPEIRGMMSASWFFCKRTLEISPSMRWVRTLPESSGAYFFEIGPSRPDAGFLVGNKLRRELYEKGEYQPMDTCCIWPRRALIQWARQHPELEDLA